MLCQYILTTGINYWLVIGPINIFGGLSINPLHIHIVPIIPNSPIRLLLHHAVIGQQVHIIKPDIQLLHEGQPNIDIPADMCS